jgi:hypothetical protein
VAFGHVIRQQLAGASSVGEAALTKATVRLITWRDAKEIISLYEPMPAVSSLAYGLFIGDHLAAAVVFCPDPSANLQDHYNGSTIALLRGACAPRAPRNAASKLIRAAMRLLPKQYKVVTAFADATVGERGGSKGGRRVLIRYQGRWLSERSARRRFGTSSASKLARLGFRVETVPRRERWFAFRSTRQQQRRLRTEIAAIA